MYIVQFIRVDEHPDEKYFYNDLKSAKEHFDLFLNDDSGLYLAIRLLRSEKSTPISTEILLGLSEQEMQVIHAFGKDEQFETCLALTQKAKLALNATLRDTLISARIKLANLTPNKFPALLQLLDGISASKIE